MDWAKQNNLLLEHHPSISSPDDLLEYIITINRPRSIQINLPPSLPRVANNFLITIFKICYASNCEMIRKESTLKPILDVK